MLLTNTITSERGLPLIPKRYTQHVNILADLLGEEGIEGVEVTQSAGLPSAGYALEAKALLGIERVEQGGVEASIPFCYT